MLNWKTITRKFIGKQILSVDLDEPCTIRSSPARHGAFLQIQAFGRCACDPRTEQALGKWACRANVRNRCGAASPWNVWHSLYDENDEARRSVAQHQARGTLQGMRHEALCSLYTEYTKYMKNRRTDIQFGNWIGRTFTIWRDSVIFLYSHIPSDSNSRDWIK